MTAFGDAAGMAGCRYQRTLLSPLISRLTLAFVMLAPDDRGRLDGDRCANVGRLADASTRRKHPAVPADGSEPITRSLLPDPAFP